MPKELGATRLRGVALTGMILVVTAASLGGCRQPAPPEDGCADDHDRQRAQALAQLSVITAHPDPAEVVAGGPGCDPAAGGVGASRVYYWAGLDPHAVVTFHLAVAATDGWRHPLSGEPVRPPTAGPKPHDLSTNICLAKRIDGSTAFWNLSFPDSSPYGVHGNVYDVDVWTLGPGQRPDC